MFLLIKIHHKHTVAISPLQDMRKYIIFATSKKGMGLPCYKPLKKLIVPVVS